MIVMIKHLFLSKSSFLQLFGSANNVVYQDLSVISAVLEGTSQSASPTPRAVKEERVGKVINVPTGRMSTETVTAVALTGTLTNDVMW